jgi:cytochrome b6-f complex iron-sulfur subunit
MNRRELVQKIVLGGTVLIFVPSVIESCTKAPVTDPGGSKINLDLSLPDNSSLNTTGGSKIVQNIIVINTGSSNFVALSSICTHMGCTVGYDSGAGNIKCPCHGSVYATTGSVITGPAPAALHSYAISKTGNILTITT